MRLSADYETNPICPLEMKLKKRSHCETKPVAKRVGEIVDGLDGFDFKGCGRRRWNSVKRNSLRRLGQQHRVSRSAERTLSWVGNGRPVPNELRNAEETI